MRFLHQAGDSKSLMRTDDKILFQLSFNSIRRGIFFQSFFQSGTAATFFTFAEDNNYAAILNSTPGIIHRLLQLINIDILRITAAAGNNYIRRLADRHAINLFHKFAGLKMCFIPVTGKNLQELLLSIQNRMEQEHLVLFGKKTHARDLIIVYRITMQLA